MDRDWIIIVVLGIAWGTTFFFNEMLLRDLGPLSISLSRVGIAAATCWTYLIATGQSGRVPPVAMLSLAVMGVSMFAVPFSVFPIGQQYVATGVAGIINALTPVMVVVISHMWPGGERATFLKSLGVVAGFLGIVFLTIPAFQSGQSTKIFGTLVILAAPIGYAIGLNWVRRFSGIPMSVVTTWAFTFAALLLFPIVLLSEGVPGGIQLTSWVSMLLLGVVLTGISFMVGFAILPRAGATKTSSVTFIAPVSALLIGWWVLGERLGPAHFAGMTAIFLGLLLIDGRLFTRKLN